MGWGAMVAARRADLRCRGMAMPPSARPVGFDALRALPTAVERWWVAQARAPVPGSTEAEALRRLAPAVQRLSDAFTCARPAAFGDYARSAEERLAYGLWYFPQTWVRARLPLEEARRVRSWTPQAGRPLRVLDVGAGTGAAGLSVATWLRGLPGAGPVTLVALDHAPGALDALQTLTREAVPEALRPRVERVHADARQPAAWPAAAQGPFDLIVVSFTLNEVFPLGQAGDAAWLEALSARLAPTGLLLVEEPAVKESAARLLERAADLVERAGLSAWGPQLHAGPWRPSPDRRTWMHEVRRWQAPLSLSILNRTLWRSMAELTFAYALLGRSVPEPLPATPALLRVASPVRALKGRLTWLGLSSEGRLGEYEVQTRDLGAPDKARFLRLERGDVLDVDVLLPLGRPDAWRLPGPQALRRHVSLGP